MRTRLEEITARFSPYRRTNRLLDVGCGSGALLEAAQRNGWTAQGVDVSPTAAKHVRSLGFEVFHGELREAQLPAAQFDVVTAGELLEHVFEPQDVVQEIARLLRPGGLFWTTTPHANGISARLLGLKWSNVCPPEHLQLFSAGGLRRLLRDAGFREIRVKTEGTNPVELWRAFRGETGTTADVTEPFRERVGTGYQVNEALTKNGVRLKVKITLNGLLNISRLGDSLKIFALR